MRSRMDSRAGLSGTALPPAASAVRRRVGRDGFLRPAMLGVLYSVLADSTPGIVRSFASTSGVIGASVSMIV